MATNIVVPELGESVLQATVARWRKKEGDPVGVGEAVVELETEKIDVEVGAAEAGILARIERKEGEDVKVGDVLGVIEEVKGAPPMRKEDLAPPPEGEKEHPSAAPSQGATKPPEKKSKPRAQVKEKVTPFTPPRIAPEGRPEERVRLSRRRRTIAQRLVEAQHTAAILTTFNEIDMTRILELRKDHASSFEKQHGVKLGIVSFFVKAAIGALKSYPAFNSELKDDELLIKHYYDIGVAIGASEGLVVPVLRAADRMSFAELEKAIKEFARKAEEGGLSPEDLRGGTFTITNGGVFGSLFSTPILNPPEAAILGLHKIEERPIALGGQVVVRPMMYAALSYDHRIVDGREAVQFLVRVKELAEDPRALLLDG